VSLHRNLSLWRVIPNASSSTSKIRVFAEKANCALRRAVKLAGKTETFYQAEAPWMAIRCVPDKMQGEPKPIAARL